MKQVLIFCITMLGLLQSLAAQDSTVNLKCFPFGSSLYRARVSSDGERLSLQDVRFNYKVFDLQTGSVIAFAKDEDWSKVIRPFLGWGLKTVPKEERNYSVYENVIREKGKQDYHFTVKDTLGNIVIDYLEKDVNWHAFNIKNGHLVMGTGGSIYLFTPGKKRKKIVNAETTRDGNSYYRDTKDFIDDAKFSPNGRYMVSSNGYITDLQEERVLKNAFVVDNKKRAKGPRPFDISFNDESTTCTVSVHEVGLCTYNLSTGKLVDKVLIPELVTYPGLKEMFEIVQIPNTKNYIYWLNFFNKDAPAGLAYYIKDGSPLPICDPNWENERIANYLEKLSEHYEQEAINKVAAEKLRKEQEANRLANANQKQPVVQKAPERRLVQQVCGYCNGSGTISFEKFIVGGKSETTVTTGLYGRRTYETTGGRGYATCRGCNGEKYVKVWKD